MGGEGEHSMGRVKKNPSQAAASGNDSDARNLTVNFTKLDLATLKSLKRHYRLKTREKATRSELAQAVAKHFAAENIDEGDTISQFIFSHQASQMQYERRDYLLQGVCKPHRAWLRLGISPLTPSPS